jgi:hypothetical protein
MMDLALFVANDVWKYDRDTVEHMCDESSCKVVIDFFEAHEDNFASDCSMQIKFAEQFQALLGAEE